MGRRATCAAAFVTLVALIGAPASTAFGATTVDEVVAPVPLDSPTGPYIVVLEESPAAGYGGGVAGLAPTLPEEGEKLDPHSPRVQKYAAYLQKRQDDVAAAAEVEPATTYQVTLNGFSAKMSPEAAARVAATDGVRAVYPDEIFRPDAVPPADHLGLEDAGGAWESLGGADVAGTGVVVGVIDMGIAPENPSFAGERLRKVRGAEPYLVGNEVVFVKAGGGQFRGTRASGDGWSDADYSTKLIGAQYFATGAIDAGIALESRRAVAAGQRRPRLPDGEHRRRQRRRRGDRRRDRLRTGLGRRAGGEDRRYKACFAGPDPLVSTDDIVRGQRPARRDRARRRRRSRRHRLLDRWRRGGFGLTRRHRALPRGDRRRLHRGERRQRRPRRIDRRRRGRPGTRPSRHRRSPRSRPPFSCRRASPPPASRCPFRQSRSARLSCTRARRDWQGRPKPASAISERSIRPW